jgi:DNA-directed RNA polymerase specialized sigma24 family protein
MNIETLVSEASRFASEDVRQEYLMLRLEGLTHEEAVARSGAADPLASRNKQRGPLVNGQRPMVSHYRETDNVRSSTVDHRTDLERHDDWDAHDLATDTVNSILERLAPAQAEAVRTVYGLQTGTKLSHADAAIQVGVPHRTMKHRIRSAHQKMQKIVDAQAA